MNLKINMPKIDLNPQDWNEVCHVLRAHVPEYTVWAFGSRVKWTAKAYSDLDLAIITEQPLSLTKMATIKEAFDESNLSIRVDIVDWAATSETFHKIIEQDKVVIQKEKQTRPLGRISPSSVTLQATDTTTEADVGLRNANPTCADEVLEHSLISLCLKIVDCPHATPKWTDSGVVVLRNQNIKGGRLDLSSPSFTNEENYQGRVKRAKPQAGDVVITREAPMGDVCQIPKDLRCCLGQRQVLLRPDPNKIDGRFLLFALQSPYIQHQIGWNEGTGSTVSNLRIPVLEALKIPTPSMKVQLEIATTLGALDNRIALLRETNTTLEAIAQALFKSWFVDFDPVHAKQQVRDPEGVDSATAALFPDSFEESELGLVPRGWRVDSIYVAAQVIYGAPFASSKFNSESVGKPLIRIRNLKKEAPGVFTPEVHPKGYLVQPGDIVVGMDGEFRAYLWGGEEAWLNQRVCVFVPNKGFSATFVHRSIMPILAAVEASETATTVIHLGKNDIDRFRIVIPDGAVLKAFGEITDSIYKKIVEQKQTSRTLANLRDTLLPRLISGQLRLPDAEALVEKAGA